MTIAINNFYKKIIVLLIIFCFIFTPFVVHADTIADKQRQLDTLKKQMNEQKALIAQKQKEVQSLANEIALMDGQIKETELAIQATAIDIDKTTEEIGIKEQELKDQQKILNESLRLMYEEKETSLFETLLSSKSFSAVLDRMEYLNVVKGKIDSTITEIKKIKSDLESKKANLEQLQTEHVAQKTDLDSKRNERNQLLEQTKGEEALYQQKLSTDKAKAAEVKSEMARMEAASQKRGGNYIGPPSPFGFQWPTVSHWISCYYGWEGCPLYKGRTHTGIDLPGPLNTDIYAVADGWVDRIATDGYNDGYGRYILLIHGGGFRTRYAHLNEVSITGGEVKRGQQIGKMGKTGNTTGVHLHFEILANNCVYGCDVNPLQYLP